MTKQPSSYDMSLIKKIKEKQICIDSLVTYIYENICNKDNEKLKEVLKDCHCFSDETIEAYCRD